MNLINWVRDLYRQWRKYRVRIAQEKEERLLNMSDKEALDYCFPLFYELGAVEAGRWMDDWRRRKAAREANTKLAR